MEKVFSSKLVSELTAYHKSIKKCFSQAIEAGANKKGQYTIIIKESIPDRLKSIMQKEGIRPLIDESAGIWVFTDKKKSINQNEINTRTETVTIPKTEEKKRVFTIRLKKPQDYYSFSEKDILKAEINFSKAFDTTRNYDTKPPLVKMPYTLEEHGLKREEFTESVYNSLKDFENMTTLIARSFNTQSEALWDVMKETGVYSDKDLEDLKELTLKYIFNTEMASTEVTKGQNLHGAVGTNEAFKCFEKYEKLTMKRMNQMFMKNEGLKKYRKSEKLDILKPVASRMTGNFKESIDNFYKNDYSVDIMDDLINLLKDKKNVPKLLLLVKDYIERKDEDGAMKIIMSQRKILHDAITLYEINNVFSKIEIAQIRYLLDYVFDYIQSKEFLYEEVSETLFEDISNNIGVKDGEKEEVRPENKKRSYPYGRQSVAWIWFAVVFTIGFFVFFIHLLTGFKPSASYDFLVGKGSVRNDTINSALSLSEHMKNVNKNMQDLVEKINSAAKDLDIQPVKLTILDSNIGDYNWDGILRKQLEIKDKMGEIFLKAAKRYNEAYKQSNQANLLNIVALENSLKERRTAFERAFDFFDEKQLSELDKIIEEETNIPNFVKYVKVHYMNTIQTVLGMSTMQTQTEANLVESTNDWVTGSINMLNSTSISVQEKGSEFQMETRSDILRDINNQHKINADGSTLVNAVMKIKTERLEEWLSIENIESSTLNNAVQSSEAESIILRFMKETFEKSNELKKKIYAGEKELLDREIAKSASTLNMATSYLTSSRINIISHMTDMNTRVFQFNQLVEAYKSYIKEDFKFASLEARVHENIKRYLKNYQTGEEVDLEYLNTTLSSLDRSLEDATNYLSTIDAIRNGIPITQGSILNRRIDQSIGKGFVSEFFKEASGFNTLRLFEKIRIIRSFITDSPAINTVKRVSNWMVDNFSFWGLLSFMFGRSYLFRCVADLYFSYIVTKEIRKRESIDKVREASLKIKEVDGTLRDIASKGSDEEKREAIKRSFSELNNKSNLEDIKEQSFSDKYLRPGSIFSLFGKGLALFADGASRIFHTLSYVYFLDNSLNIFGGTILNVILSVVKIAPLWISFGLESFRGALGSASSFFYAALFTGSTSLLVKMIYQILFTIDPQKIRDAFGRARTNSKALIESFAGLLKSIFIDGLYYYTVYSLPVLLAKSTCTFLLGMDNEEIDSLSDEIIKERFKSIGSVLADTVMLLDQRPRDLSRLSKENLKLLQYSLVLSVFKSIYLAGVSYISGNAFLGAMSYSGNRNRFSNSDSITPNNDTSNTTDTFEILKNMNTETLSDEKLAQQIKSLEYFIYNDEAMSQWIIDGPNHNIDNALAFIGNTTTIPVIDKNVILQMSWLISAYDNLDPITKEQYIQVIRPFIERYREMFDSRNVGEGGSFQLIRMLEKSLIST